LHEKPAIFRYAGWMIRFSPDTGYYQLPNVTRNRIKT